MPRSDMNRDDRRQGLRLNLGLTAGVMATVLIALVMAQLDALQGQKPGYSRLVIANVQATAVANGAVIPLPYNGATSNNPVGQEQPAIDPNATIVPDVNPRTGETDTGSAPDFPVCGEVPAGWLLYTVATGDTVNSLASATQSEPNAILSANCLSSDVLTAGMQILLPSEPSAAVQCGPPQSWVRYQVQPGDTVGSLAASRGTTVAAILQANCRDSEALTVGQMIFLPPGGPVSPPVVAPPVATSVPPTPGATATVSAVPSSAPPVAPSAVPTNAPPAPTSAPVFTPVPTRIFPTATPPVGPTATPPSLPTTAPTIAPTIAPTRVPPTATSPAPTAVPTRVPPTATVPPPPTNTPVPPPTDTPPPPPTNTPVPPPTDTPVPPPTDTPEPPPTNTPEPPPPSTPEPDPTATPEPDPTQAWYRAIVWPWYWR
ncbi:MAG: LysM peptidoglycan-binding domain-containing protein [Chloroflexota bacterium]